MLSTGLAHATCLQTDTKEVQLVDKPPVWLKLEACLGEGATHRLSVRLVEGALTVHAEDLVVEGRSYVLSVSTDLDLDSDGTADIAVSTGRGRAGDGMRYWLLKRYPTRLIEVGEAPQLAWSTGAPRRLFALVPGGAEVQATRVEYRVLRRRLVPVRFLQFIPLDSGAYEVRVLDPRSSAAAAQTLACRAEGAAAVLSMKNGSGVAVVVPHRADICEAGFVFEPLPGVPARGRLMLAPLELGLNARQSVMSVDFLRGSSSLLGELPAAAERKRFGVYEHITQEGGSLFLATFKINDDGVELAPVGLELVVDAELCVDQPNAVRVLGLGVDPPCSQRVQATRIKPVCLVHRADSHRAVALGRCRSLMKRWQQP